MNIRALCRFIYLFSIISLSLHSNTIQSHGFCEHTIIKHSHVSDEPILAVCKKAVRKQKICVPSYDIDTHVHIVHKRVQKGGQSSVPWYVRLSCDRAQQHTISCSPLQQFYDVDTEAWVPAYHIDMGDRLLTYAGPRAVTSIEYVEEELKVYALEIEFPHTFFVGHDALLTHNMELPAAWVITPLMAFSSGAALSISSGTIAGIALTPLIAPAVIVAGLALSSALTSLVSSICADILPTYHAAVHDVCSLFGINQNDQNKSKPTTGDSNQPTNSPKKDDNNEKTAKMPNCESRLGHIFKSAQGHLPRTAYNYKLIEELVKDIKNYLGPDGRGNHWWAKLLENGEQIWAQAYDGVVRNGGLNKIPKPYNAQTGLSRCI